MAKFQVEWTEESFYRVVIEADDKQQAIDKWSARDFYGEDLFGGEIQDGVDITELED